MIKWIFDSADFVARAHCGSGWTKLLILLNISFNIVIFLSYMTISISLLFLYLMKKSDWPIAILRFLLFSFFFIFFCGITHLDDIIVFSYPIYRYFTINKSITAFFSGVTVCLLPMVFKFINTAPSYERLRTLNERLQIEILKVELIKRDCEQHNHKLKLQLTKLEADMEHTQWIGETSNTLDKLKSMLEERFDV